jgi:hypothetical protein
MVLDIANFKAHLPWPACPAMALWPDQAAFL